MNIRKTSAVSALMAISALGVRGAEETRAHLSDDPLGHIARHTSERTRVIVHGDADALAPLTAKHHVQILRTLSGGAVIWASSAELDEIANDSAFDHLSGDPFVKVGMAVSNQSTAADQVRAGVAGGLLGVGAIPGVNGQGIGVAIVDSGISPHAALVGKVVSQTLIWGTSMTAEDPK
jgi:subtilisin family serine protease